MKIEENVIEENVKVSTCSIRIKEQIRLHLLVFVRSHSMHGILREQLMICNLVEFGKINKNCENT